MLPYFFLFRMSKKFKSHLLFTTILRKFIGVLTKSGRKYIALRILRDSLSFLKSMTRLSPLQVLSIALLNLRPFILINTIKRRKSFIKQAMLLDPGLQIKKSIKYLFGLANQLSKVHSLSKRLSYVVINSFFKRGKIFREIRKLNSIVRVGQVNLIKHLMMSSNQVGKIRVRRTKKTKGHYFQNKYGLHHKIEVSRR
jgi:ribosomal protein S7